MPMPRKICENCQRPIAVCICEHLVSLEAPCNIVILQHPSEQKQALATVPILQACLIPLTVLVGEDFSQNPTLLQLLKTPEDIAIVFPTDDAEAWDLQQVNTAFNPPKTLIVLDGTWRKAKLIWHKNPCLHNLRTVALKGIADSQYLIRSSTIEGGVSTLEAVMHCCNYLSSTQRFDPLLNPFKAMVDWQIKKMGKETFLAHYGNKEDQ